MKLTKKQIAHQFNRASQTYESTASLQNEMASVLLDQIPVNQSGTLVDLGCGTGWLLRQIASRPENQFRLIGVDLAEGMIEATRNQVKSADLYCCDLEQTPLKNQSADLIVSNAAIQWCDSRDAVIEIDRICRNGGKILIATFGPKTFRELRSAWEAVGDKTPRIHAQLPEESWKQLLISSRFSEIQTETQMRQLNYDSVSELLDSIKKMGVTNAQSNRPNGMMGKQKFRQFCEELNKTSDHGKIGLTFEIVFISAMKP
ncbi:MAG: malonyl-ACP O-methyltransferase BioC [Planctomycetota bacterium]